MITSVHGLHIGDIVERHGTVYEVDCFPTVHLARLVPVLDKSVAAVRVPVRELQREATRC